MPAAAELLELHLRRFAQGDVDGLLSEYAEDAVFLSAQGVLRGREALRGVFQGAVAEFGQPGVSFELLARHAEGDVAYIAWRAETPGASYALGSDTLVLRDGLIVCHTAAIAMTPRR